ncbi:MAG TPA: 16S rRNA (uracil(1498)-N(3))-methyltransferase [Sphingobacteriaceae bacterium]|nr:16S rRNA (uracil(1498)-N(3))-methyltransferase [Sphingobacteriaceae bacterium]
MQLFYTPDINSDLYILNEEESRHCTKVLRLQKGDTITLTDGRGTLYTAQIVDPHLKKTCLMVLSKQTEFGKRNHYLHLAVAPTKNIERFEWFLEKATEIGIDEITPVICDRSERKEIKTDRLNKIITAAIKQSLKAYHPHLNEAVKFKTFISAKNTNKKFIAHCNQGEKSALKEVMNLNGNYTVLIGPEGDFTSEEIYLSTQNEYIPVTFGESRLRTETAALAACFEVNFLNR